MSRSTFPGLHPASGASRASPAGAGAAQGPSTRSVPSRPRGISTTVTAVIGAQFGDEAKGKISDYLAENAKYVVRSAGGPNTGHTIHLAEGTVVLHQLSCGVLRHGVVGVSGPGMVINPFQLEQEIRDLESRHLLKGEIVVSERAHVVLPVHETQDAWEDGLRAEFAPGKALGTTKRGIGPAYADRYARFGIRFGDLTRPSQLAERLDMLYRTKAYLGDLPDRAELTQRLSEVGGRLAPMIRPTEPMLWSAVENEENVLLEGAQSALLDIDFGTYPYVSSSHPTAAGAMMGSGIPPQELDEAVGVAKAYATRVGTGPFPTEVTGETAEFLQREGAERGATTGRLRRVGWLDLVLLRYVAKLNGLTSLAITKVDILSGLTEVPVCVRYETSSGASLTDYPPSDAGELARVTPVYQNFPSWPEFNARLKERLHREGPQALPGTLRRFLDFVTRETGVPVEYVGFGAGREETVWLGRGARAPLHTGLTSWSG